jgi:hypothetical protein
LFKGFVYSGDQIKENEMGGAGLMSGGKQNAYKIFVWGGGGGHEGKGPIGRHRNRWILTVIIWEGVDFTHMPQDRDKW